MPYIKSGPRGYYDCILEELDYGCNEFDKKVKVALDSEELNYCITKVCHDWIVANGLNYKNLNTIIGVLECAKLELYRQIAAPYEREKHKVNGHISELDKNGQ